MMKRLFGYLDRVHELAERPTALDKLNEVLIGPALNHYSKNI